MTQYMSVTMDDCKEGEWTYSMQYMGRIVRISVPDPVETMSIAQQESMFTTLLTEGFNIMRERKLLQSPEEAVDEYVEKIMPKQFGSSYEEEEEEVELEDMTLREILMAIIDRLTDPNE